jgi:hypothetical protein
MTTSEESDRFADELRALRPRALSESTRAAVAARVNVSRSSVRLRRSVAAVAASAALVAILFTLRVDDPPASQPDSAAVVPAGAVEPPAACECRVRFGRPSPSAMRVAPPSRGGRLA